MGTYYRVQVVADEALSEVGREALAAVIEGELDDVNQRMSTYLADSELSRLNRHADGAPFALSAATFEVLGTAVEVGGEVRAGGKSPRGDRWRLGIERPGLRLGAVQRIVPLADLAVATSGDYRNYREVDGERFSHIIDPRSGWPIRHRLASVSVFHESCMIADALATALLVLGEEEGYQLALAENLPVFFLVRDGEGFVERGTPAFWELEDRSGIEAPEDP